MGTWVRHPSDHSSMMQAMILVLDKLQAQQIITGIFCTIHDLKMASKDPGLAMPSKILPSKGKSVRLHNWPVTV